MAVRSDRRESIAIVSRRRLHDGAIAVDRIHAQEVRTADAVVDDGATAVRIKTTDLVQTTDIVQEVAVTADRAAVLVHDRGTGQVWLARQFCAAALEADARWRPWGGAQSGAIACLPRTPVRAGEPPEAAAQRAMTLAGVAPDAPAAVERIALFYASPATATERVHLFYAETAAGEGEATLPADAFMDAGRRGLIDDAATLIAAQWLAGRQRA